MSRIGCLQGSYLGTYYGPRCNNWSPGGDPEFCKFCTEGQNLGREEDLDKSIEDIVETVVAARRESGITFVHFNTGFVDGNEYYRMLSPVFQAVKTQIGCPVLTDVHLPDHCAAVAEAVDILQIPAFLSRQTDLLLAAASTGRAINVKKGQFLAPWDMANVAAKIERGGNRNILLCERGVSFGYNTLVSDMRALPILAGTGYPVVFDATHSVQQPGGRGGSSGGQREFVPVLARAAVSIGVAAIFMETHQDPDAAPSDGPNMVPLARLEAILRDLIAFDRLAKAHPISLS